jgi:hypothetical protein
MFEGPNGKQIDLQEFMRAAVSGIEDEDHRVVVLERGEFISDAVAEWMEADGYKFAASPAADVTGQRKVYFTREPGVVPTPRM